MNSWNGFEFLNQFTDFITIKLSLNMHVSIMNKAITINGEQIVAFATAELQSTNNLSFVESNRLQYMIKPCKYRL